MDAELTQLKEKRRAEREEFAKLHKMLKAIENTHEKQGRSRQSKEEYWSTVQLAEDIWEEFTTTQQNIEEIDWEINFLREQKVKNEIIRAFGSLSILSDTTTDKYEWRTSQPTAEIDRKTYPDEDGFKSKSTYAQAAR